jgi:hypothetical protein
MTKIDRRSFLAGAAVIAPAGASAAATDKDKDGHIRTEPKVTKEDVLSWCPEPRGDQKPGFHAEIPAMRLENAAAYGKDDENRVLGDKLVEAFQQNKPTHGNFVLQWRMFPKLDAPPASCGCGCSCGCG